MLTPYSTLHRATTDLLPLPTGEINLEPITGSRVTCRSHEFESNNWDVHPPANYENSGPTYEALIAYFLQQNPHSGRAFTQELHRPDRDVSENRRFTYLILSPNGTSRASRATLLLHGLNEKTWHKYLPWAVRLVELTGNPVILFPLAFHLNRAPSAWSDPRDMMGVYRERKNLFGTLSSGSFANAALSHRVQFAPHRFLTSSFQSYYDIVDLARRVANGSIPGLTSGCKLDLFGYSIGASLATLLLMRDPGHLFSGSQAFLFCGGAVLEDANPVSRAIIDEAAYSGLTGYLSRLVTRVQQALPDDIVRPGRRSRELRLFRSLIFRKPLRGVRERAMRRINVRVRALGLDRDPVFPPAGIRRSWTGRGGSSLLRLYTRDATVPYSHEKPFPSDAMHEQEVETLFSSVFQAAAHHLVGAPLHAPAAVEIV
jgi:pimeloyl-ACP methyl ester carboxylesterase